MARKRKVRRVAEKMSHRTKKKRIRTVTRKDTYQLSRRKTKLCLAPNGSRSRFRSITPAGWGSPRRSMFEERNQIRVLTRRFVGGRVVFSNDLIVCGGVGMDFDTLLLIQPTMRCIRRKFDRFGLLRCSFDWRPSGNTSSNHTSHGSSWAKRRV